MQDSYWIEAPLMIKEVEFNPSDEEALDDDDDEALEEAKSEIWFPKYTLRVYILYTPSK